MIIEDYDYYKSLWGGNLFRANNNIWECMFTDGTWSTPQYSSDGVNFYELTEISHEDAFLELI